MLVKILLYLHKYCEVIGFIEPNAKWLSDSAPIESLLISLDDKVISPYTQNDNKDKSFIRAKSQVTYLTINDKSFLEDIKNKVEAIGKENLVLEQAVNNLNSRQLSKIRNKTISFIFQHFALMKEYSVYDNVELPLTMRKMPNRQKKDIVMHCLKRLGIEEYANKKPNQLSGGRQQRAAIGRALGSDAQIILADEPTGALDQKTGTEVMNILSEINKDGKTIIVATHDNRVASYCNRKIIIEYGKKWMIVESISNREHDIQIEHALYFLYLKLNPQIFN